MLRTVIAGIVFALLYGVALRLHSVLRAQREADRWHPTALTVAATLGGLAFYLAQQIRRPHVPTWLDLPAFAILMVAGGAIPLILEVTQVARARVLRRTRFRTPDVPRGRPSEDP